jgi:hypothetical protein
MLQPQPWVRNQGKGLQGCGQRGKFGSARQCEGIDPHLPKGTPTLGVGVLGVGVLVDSRMFRGRMQRSKPNGLRSSLYHLKIIET